MNLFLNILLIALPILAAVLFAFNKNVKLVNFAVLIFAAANCILSLLIDNNALSKLFLIICSLIVLVIVIYSLILLKSDLINGSCSESDVIRIYFIIPVFTVLVNLLTMFNEIWIVMCLLFALILLTCFFLYSNKVSKSQFQIYTIVSCITPAAVLYVIFMLYRTMRLSESGTAGFLGNLLTFGGICLIIYSLSRINNNKSFMGIINYFSLFNIGMVLIGISTFTSTSIYWGILYFISYCIFRIILMVSVIKIQKYYNSDDILYISGVMTQMPSIGFIFMLSSFALLGMPPFGMFFSSLGIINNAFVVNNYLVGAAIPVLSVFGYYFYLRNINTIIFGDVTKHEITENDEWNITVTGTVTAFIILIGLIIGITVPAYLDSILNFVRAFILGTI